MAIAQQIVRVTGVRVASQLRQKIGVKYPNARIEIVDTGVAYVTLPQVTWRMTPGGEEGFFSMLYLQGVISSYERLAGRE